MNFISAYMEHTKEFESPGSFWKWSAYVTLSAVLRDCVWKDDGDSRLYPNIYVLFLAGSGARKARPVNTSEGLIKKIGGTKIIAGRSSIQAIVDDLTITESSPVTGKVQKSGAAIFYAPELSANIVADPAAISILTDIYDGKDNYTTALRSRGKSGGGPVVFSMLAASNEAMLEDTYTVRAIEGGLLARTFLVVPNEFRPANSLLIKVDRSMSYNNLLTTLGQVAKLQGAISFEASAAYEYDSWYKDFRTSIKNKPDKSGVMGRLHTGVMKLMIILAANDYTTNIRKSHVDEAINDCVSILPNYHKFIMSTGSSDASKGGSRVLTDLYDAPNHTLSRRDLLSRHWTIFTSEDLQMITDTLQAAGYIEIYSGGGVGNIFYKLTEKALEMWKEG